jgi:hypothetical protein
VVVVKVVGVTVVDIGCPEEETLNIVERAVMVDVDVEFESTTGLTAPYA